MPALSLSAFATVPAFRFSLGDLGSAVGRWSRIATYGYKGAKGEGLDFTVSTLSQMVDNAAARGDRIAICQDHLSILGPPQGRPAPSLGFFHALALFDETGKLVSHWTMDSGGSPTALDAAGQPRVGLYARLGEITPLGHDPLQGLANYGFLSPTFPPPQAATDEAGNPIGYALIDVAATSAPFQAGCAIEMHQVGAAAPPPPPATGAASALNHLRGAPMDPKILQKLGLAATATDAEKLAALKKFSGDATVQLAALDAAACKSMGDDLETMSELADDETKKAMRALAARFRKMAGSEAPAVAEPAPASLAEPDGDEATVGEVEKAMDQTLERGTDKGEAQNAAIHIKTGQEHSGMQRMARSDAQAMVILAQSLRARGVSVPPTATRSILMALAASVPAPAQLNVAEMVKQEIARQRAADDKVAQDKEAAALVAMARTAKAPEHEIAALAIVAKSDLVTARAMAKKFDPTHSGAPANLLSMLTSPRGPVAAVPGAQHVPAVVPPSGIDRKVVQMAASIQGSRVAVLSAGTWTDECKRIADPKCVEFAGRVDGMLDEGIKGSKYEAFERFIAAEKILMSDRPDLYQAARAATSLPLGA